MDELPLNLSSALKCKSVRPLLYWRTLPYNNYLRVHVSDTFEVPRNILGSDK